MNSVAEERICAAFAGLGFKSSLADGFRLKTKGQQTVAVYFSGNEPGNAVEMGLSARCQLPWPVGVNYPGRWKRGMMGLAFRL